MEEQEVAPVVAIAWGVAAQPQRGPRRELTVEQVVAAAVEIADAEGLGAVTMQRVAGTFGFTTMAIYRYVPTKDALHQLMVDSVFGAGQPHVSADDWRRGIAEWSRWALDLYAAHPWTLDIPASHEALLLPGQASAADAALRGLRSLPVGPEERIGLLMSLSTFVRGHATLVRDVGSAPPPSAATRALVRREVTDGTHPDLAPLVASGLYFGEGWPGPEDGASDGEPATGLDPEDFTIGLDIFLAGIEATLGGPGRV